MTELKDYTVYKIVLSDGYEYVGSSYNYKRRISCHISNCYNINNKDYNIPLYKHIRENKLKFDKDCFMVLEEVKNITKTQSRIIEENYRKNAVLQGGNIVLNAQRAHRTEEELKQDYIENRDKTLEQRKEYRHQNRDKVLEQKKKYYTQNREKILKKQKEKYTCICGSTSTKNNKIRHERSIKHINFISQSSN
jgi:hypothetical protein